MIGIGANAAQALAPYRTVIHGERIAIIAATDVIDTNLMTSWSATGAQGGVASAYQLPELLQSVRAARRTADTVVVFLHWGTELQTCPTARQLALAQQLAGAGADIIVGSHAHVQLGAGYLGRAFVDYGLGNLAFYAGQGPSAEAGVLKVTVTGRHIDSYGWQPALLQSGEPSPLDGAAAQDAISRWSALRRCTNLAAVAPA